MTGRIEVVYAAAGAAAYLLGAVPFGLLVARARGVDIRAVGSRNIGATNVFRCVGKSWGLLTFLLDAVKGFLPAFVLPRLAAAAAPAVHVPALSVACCALAVAGHNWPVYIGFKGGKGVATSVGALLGLAPAAAGIGIAVWAAALLAGRYVSLASIAAAVAIPVYAWLSRAQGERLLPIALTALGALAILRHRANIGRLLNGTEHRFDFRRRRGPAADA